MGILTAFLGSDLNLKRPDFKNSPVVSLDFSGTNIEFSDPAQTSMFPVQDWPNDLDIYDERCYEKQRGGDFAKRFYVKGWDLTGAKRQAKAGVKVSGILSFFSDEYAQTVKGAMNCFNSSCFSYEVLRFCHDVWGGQNEAKDVGDLGNGLFSYPVESKELMYKDINGTVWCYFSFSVKGKAPKFIYATAVSKYHIIFNEFTITPYDDLDYFSPDTNLEVAANGVVDDFMAHYVINLSKTAESEKAQVESHLAEIT